VCGGGVGKSDDLPKGRFKGLMVWACVSVVCVRC
jgi:hypothetical protein